MTVKPTIRPLETGEITVMSHVTSITVTGNKISKLEATDNPTTIHLNFEVEGKKGEPCILAGAEELGFILHPKDALELGLSLVEMGLEKLTAAEAKAIQERLSQLLERSQVAPMGN